MPNDLFDGIACFQDGLSTSDRGRLALRLTKACQAAPEARPAAQALGSLFDPAKRAEALSGLNSMPEAARRAVRLKYDALSRLSRD